MSDVRLIDPDEAQRLGLKGTSDDDPSGRSLAEAAHEAGAVTQAAPAVMYDVTITAAVTGSRFAAEYVAALLAQHCERIGDVTSYSFTVAERAA